MILRRHANVDGQNLQGHVKQSFFAAFRFFAEQPSFIPLVASALRRLEDDEMYELDPATEGAWLQHVDEHALDSGDEWSYAILRSVMPPSLGGTRQGGGGGSSTLKRMLPLVAEWVTQRLVIE
jgi:hypothetical protein